MSRKKTTREKELSNTKRNDRDTTADVEKMLEVINGNANNIISDIKPREHWLDITKEMFNYIIQPQCAMNQLYKQDVPTLIHMGDCLNEVELAEAERLAYEAKNALNEKEIEDDYIDRLLNRKLKFMKLYSSLVKDYLVSPMGRLRAAAVFTLTEGKKENSVLKIIDEGRL